MGTKRLTVEWGTKGIHPHSPSGHFQKNNLEMSSRKTAGRRGTTKKRAQRATSNVFAMFNQDQIQEFKEAFNMIDHNRFNSVQYIQYTPGSLSGV